MDGVTVLNSYEVVADSTFNFIAFLIVLIGTAISFCLEGIHEYISQESEIKDVLICTAIGILIGMLFGAMAGVAASYPSKYETQYKVMISEQVMMQEFMSKYEVIDVEGKILTVREVDAAVVE